MADGAMEIEISAMDEEAKELNPNAEVDPDERTFADTFMEKVSIKTIMANATSIGRNEARLMLAQLRETQLQNVGPNDPGVLMLDGLPKHDIRSYINDGGDDLKATLLGLNSTNMSITPRGANEEGKDFNEHNQYNRHINELITCLNNLKDSHDYVVKDQYRKEFFEIYTYLDAVHKVQMLPAVKN